MENLVLIKHWTLLLLSLSLTTVAVAQTQPAGPTPAERLLAAQFEYAAAPFLNPGDAAYDAQVYTARVLIDQANALDPTNANRWWTAADLAARSFDPDAEKAALRQYLKLEPSNDFAQLRLIDLYLADRQTVDERITLCGRFVEGASAKKFTSPLRSRLALRAALMHREQGQVNEFQRLLALSLQLDPTNQEAAAESFRAVTADPDATTPQKAAALFTLFNANPTDPATHLGVGDTLMEFGLYAQAYEWFTSATTLTRMRGQRTDLPLMHAAAMSMWGSGQTEQAMLLLNAIDRPAPGADGNTEPAAATTDAAPTEGGDTAAPAPEALAPDGRTPLADWPPVESLMLKAAVVSTSAKPEGLDELYQRIEKRLLSRKTEQVNPDDLTNLIWARLLFNQAIDSTPALIERIEKVDGEQPVLRGWLAARQGKADQARQLLEPLADTDARAALGLTLGRELDGADAGGVALLQKVATAAPYDIFGLIAVAQLRAAGVKAQVSPDAQQLARLFESVPDKLQHAYGHHGQFVQIRIDTPKTRFELCEPIEFTLEMRNVSDVPLSLGQGGSVGGQVLIMPRVLLSGAPQPVGVPPFTVDMHRRIRLAPRRSMSMKVRVDTANPNVGYLLQAYPQSRVQLDMVAILNPVFNARGGVVPGLLGASAQTRNLARRPIPMAPESIDAALTQVPSADPLTSMKAMAFVLPITSTLNQDEQHAERVQQIVDAVNAAYPGIDPVRQAWALSLIGGLQEMNERERFEPVYTAAAERDDEMVQLALLAFSRSISEPDDPLLTAAMRGDNEKLKAFAEARRALLEMVKQQQAEAEARAAEQEAAKDPSELLPPLDLDQLK